MNSNNIKISSNRNFGVVFFYILIFFITFFSIFHLSLPIWIDLFFTIILFLLIKDKKIVFTCSVLIFLCCISISWLWGDLRDNEVYYRPHEKFKSSKILYQKNVNANFSMLYGDLYALGLRHTYDDIEKIKEPREIIFKTDSNGFRNNYEINDSEIILSGDSFIFASATSQEDMPSSLLSKKIKKRVSNIAFPGHPEHYEKLLIKYKKEYSKDTPILVFYFEGNDFVQKNSNINKADNISKNKTDNISKNKKSYNLKDILLKIDNYYNFLEFKKDKYLNIIYPSNQVFFRLIRKESYKINFKIRELIKEKIFNKTKKYIRVKTFNLFTKEIGFLKEYMDLKYSENFENYVFKDADLIKQIKGVYFIPTKYRVYSSFLGISLNNNAFNSLKKSYSLLGIPVYDLTPSLVRRANEISSKKEFVFWRDDSHWNGAGIDAAMDKVADTLK